jgi:peptidoglycan/LPS O-acetylase OafA/YrhL
MSRSIVTKRTISPTDPDQLIPKADPYFSTIIKLIPADIISVYFALFNIIKNNKQNPDNNDILQLIVFGIFLILTPFYLKKIAKVIPARQIIYCTVAFILWVLSLGGPVDGLLIAGYQTQFLGAILLPVYTLLIPFIYSKTEMEN